MIKSIFQKKGDQVNLKKKSINPILQKMIKSIWQKLIESIKIWSSRFHKKFMKFIRKKIDDTVDLTKSDQINSRTDQVNL